MTLLAVLVAAASLPEGSTGAGAGEPVVVELSDGIRGWPAGITAGPDGNLWFTQLVGNRIGRLTPAGTVTEFSDGITPGTGMSMDGPYRIAPGPDGNLWFTQGVQNQVGRITPAGVVTEFNGAGGHPTDIVAGPDGNLWFTENYAARIGRITPAGVITHFGGLTSGAQPGPIAPGSDGNHWFGETTPAGDRIGRITTAGVVTEYPTPGPVGGIAAGPDGAIWFTTGGGAYDTGTRIGRITTAGAVQEFVDPSGASGAPGEIVSAPDGNLWFTGPGSQVGRVTPAGIVTTFRSGLSPGAEPRDITAGPDGALWFTETYLDRIGRIALPPDAPAPAPPPASVVVTAAAVTISGTTVRATYAGMKLRGSLSIAGTLTAPATVAFAVGGAAHPLASTSRSLGAGPFTVVMPLPASLLPGSYGLTATAGSQSAQATFTIRAPARGIVAAAVASGRRGGAAAATLRTPRAIHFRFRFAVLPRTGLRIAVRLSATGRPLTPRSLVRPRATTVSAVVGGSTPLPRGTYRATLVVGGVAVATAQTRVR